MKTFMGSIAVVLAAALNAWPVDGIAVSTQIRGVWNAAGDIMRYDIRNSAVVSSRMIFNGGGGFSDRSRVSARFPAFNKEGTKIAFYRLTTDSGSFICEMNPDGGAVRNLARIPQQNGYDGRGYLYWPVGKWIYYMLAGGNHQEGSKHLWRVNSETLQNEEVVVFQYGLWQWGMSADAARMHLRVWEDNGAAVSCYQYTLPGNGSIPESARIGNGAGCGANMAPSGNQLSYLQGGGHTYVACVSWANRVKENGDFGFTSEQLNAFVLPGAHQTAQCTWSDGSRIDLTAGYGMDCNRWSTNSDKWMCLQMGWIEQPGGSGRYSFCGSNQVLFNWVDSVAINASQSTRACGNGGNFETGCDISLPYSEYRRNDAGDFLVTGPLADINENLQDLITRAATEPVRRRCVQDAVSQLVMFSGRRGVHIGAQGTFTVRLIDMRGRTVVTRRIEGPETIRLTGQQARIGICSVVVESRSHASASNGR